MKTIYLAAAMASALSLSTPATAGFFDLTLAPFIGASAGQASYDISCPATSTCDDSDTAWKIYGGLEVNEYLAMEVGYADLGEAKYSGTPSGTAEVHGMTMQAVGTFAITPSLSVIGRGGMNFLNLEKNGTIAGTPTNNVGDTDVVWSLGLGAQYNLSKSVGLRAEWERYFDVGDADTTGEIDIDLISASVVYTFR
ncbi:MAG: outer membrane beta-barrel protein [Gammaproteobacteria bacterium]|nr:outer membrane beta-barrel protein [Gammaproteobacteria bacterium]